RRSHQNQCRDSTSGFKFPSFSSANSRSRAPMPYAALRLLVVVLAAEAALAVAARTDASAKLTTCFVALYNWSNAAVVAATVDLRAVTATSEPAGAFLVAFSTHAATSLAYDAPASSASAEKSACASEAIS